jgi:hypothetical protein
MHPSVLSTVWPWRESATPDRPVKAGASKIAAILQALVMSAIGAGLFWWLGHRIMGGVVWGLAAVVLLSGLFLPKVFAGIERVGKWLGHVVGIGLTWGLLVPFYYLCFCPMRLGLILKRKDPLHRKLTADATTYWTPRKPIPDVGQYRKQF